MSCSGAYNINSGAARKILTMMVSVLFSQFSGNYHSDTLVRDLKEKSTLFEVFTSKSTVPAPAAASAHRLDNGLFLVPLFRQWIPKFDISTPVAKSTPAKQSQESMVCLQDDLSHAYWNQS